jgi:hypothetical protein
LGDIIRYEGGALSRIGAQGQKRRIELQAALEVYRHDRIAEVVESRRANIDFCTAGRIQGAVLLGNVAAEAIDRCPAIANLVANALVDRERLQEKNFRAL